MRNYIFLLTVLAVTIWTSGGDQTGPNADTQNDFNFEDMEADGGSGTDEYYSSYSSYGNTEPVFPGDDEDVDIDDGNEISGYFVPVAGSMHLNRDFIEAYNRPDSLPYMELANDFILAMDELMGSSLLRDSYIGTKVLRLSPGSVKVDFEVEMEPVPRLEEALSKVIELGVNAGSLSDLKPNASSLVIKPQDTDTGITFTTMGTSNGGRVTTSPGGKDDGDKYRPQPTEKGGDDVEVEEKNILDMILEDPIIIAAIVGGLVVILLSIILLFLFVVYRLKKKDEGSYSLDEPAKAKDPTAYWKETKEFYA